MVEPQINRTTKITDKRAKFRYAVEEYRKGKSSYKIAEEIGVSGVTVRKWLKYALVPRKDGNRKYSVMLWDELANKYEDGATIASLSEEYGIPQGTLRATFSSLGIEKCKKSVAQIKDGKIVKVYQSMTEASIEIGCSISAISNVCGTDRKCKGYRWEIWTKN